MVKLGSRTTMLLIMALIGVCSLWGSSAAQAADAAKPFEGFLVYNDKPSANHYVASGFMPEGKCVSIDDVWQENCQGGSRSCIKNTYDRDCSTMSLGWAGIYWLQPANNWGDINAGFNLTGAKKLTFWARGEKGGEVIVVKMGGVGMGHEFPDSDAASSEPITLSTEWQEFSIDLTGKDLSHIIGGFAWVGTAKNNQSNITFYLDTIHYE